MSGYMSHEMLTPLKCMSLLTTKISESSGSKLDEECRHHLKVMSQTIEILLSSIK
jgi:light-regulated signal transduction histidine kinase (bacteriophytochrome)